MVSAPWPIADDTGMMRRLRRVAAHLLVLQPVQRLLDVARDDVCFVSPRAAKYRSAHQKPLIRGHFCD
jgi:hypothetical protein